MSALCWAPAGARPLLWESVAEGSFNHETWATARGEGEVSAAPAARVVGPSSNRDLLRRVARGVDRTRGSLREGDRGRSVELWSALLDGLWTIVDQFDSGGRRFIVARRNEPRVVERGRLSCRERQVLELAACGHANKVIAHDLGIPHGTVASALARAMRKLGVGSRAELVQLAAFARSAA